MSNADLLLARLSETGLLARKYKGKRHMELPDAQREAVGDVVTIIEEGARDGYEYRDWRD